MITGPDIFELGKKRGSRDRDLIIVILQRVQRIHQRANGVAWAYFNAHPAFDTPLGADHRFPAANPDSLGRAAPDTVNTPDTPFCFQMYGCYVRRLKRQGSFCKSVAVKFAADSKCGILGFHQSDISVSGKFQHRIGNLFSAGNNNAGNIHHFGGADHLGVHQAGNQNAVIRRVQHHIAHKIRCHRVGIFSCQEILISVQQSPVYQPHDLFQFHANHLPFQAALL